MASPWSASVSYLPYDKVYFNGLLYERSDYPPTATAGTAPNVETSIDPKGDVIRTWMLGDSVVYDSVFLKFKYFRLVQPTYSFNPNTGAYTPNFNYSFATDEQISPYTYITNSVDYDQAITNTAPTPNSPVCPANKCGVARQFQNEFAPLEYQVEIATHITESVPSSLNYEIYCIFNHPLYFRRSITLKHVIFRYEPGVYPSPEYSVAVTYFTFTPTDTNYCVDPPNQDYFIPENSVTTITVPADTGQYQYNYGGTTVDDVESND